MSIRSDARIKAKQLINNSRVRAEEKATTLSDKVFSEHPELLEIKKKKDAVSGKVFEAYISNDTNLAAELKDESKKLNKVFEDALTSMYGSADYLAPKYKCSICKDQGIVDGHDCKCLEELTEKIISESFVKSKVYMDCNFENFNLEYYGTEKDNMKAVADYCRDYAENFSNNSRSILMMGDTGLGKTHLSCAIANVVSEKGYYVIYGSAQNILKKIEDEHFGRSTSDTVAEINKCDLLILDDLGTEFPSAFNTSSIYDIVDTRIQTMLPVIINTNLGFEELENRYEKRILSRIVYYYDMLKFKGNDIRLAKRKER